MNNSALYPDDVAGATIELMRTSFCVASLTALSAGAHVANHVHDYPYLSVQLLGGYRERSEAGEAHIDGPAAAFHPAGSAHEDVIDDCGLRTLVIQFEPDWLDRSLGSGRMPRDSRYWVSGTRAAMARRLARRCLREGSKGDIAREAVEYLRLALDAGNDCAEPAWMDHLNDLMADRHRVLTPSQLSDALGLSQPWLARAYRSMRGEGLADALSRYRLERALQLMEDSSTSLAAIALETGFSDQSHLTRFCRLHLGCTPKQLRMNARSP